MVELAMSIEEVVKKYDLDVSVLKDEYAIDSVKKLQENIDRLDSERELAVGIIGRVKAGKSSILNAIFFDGEDVLPKAATPMTAALTILKYGENLKAEIEFFTENDISVIKQLHDKVEVNEEFQKIIDKASSETNDKNEFLSKVVKKAIQRQFVSDAEVSSWEQYERIKSVGIEEFENKEIKGDSISQIQEKLQDYVGSSGKYMPFTKSVSLTLPIENLKGVEIVDTPGVNDPVVSREERTKEFLKKCDAVLVLSNAGQFMNSEDLSLLDRVSSKEGIKEILIIPSQVDSSVRYEDVKEEAHGDLFQALELVKSKLSNQLQTIISDIKKRNPLAGAGFERILKNNKFFLTSAICYNIKKRFNQKEQDSGMNKVWNDLTKYYPDYFSPDAIALENLDKLANIENVKHYINGLKIKKEDILNKRKEEFIQAKQKALQDYRHAIESKINQEIQKIKSSDIGELREKLSEIEEKKSKIPEINYAFKDLVEEFIMDLSTQLTDEINQIFGISQKELNSAQKTESEIKSETYQAEQNGMIGGAKRFFGEILGQDDWGYETKTRTYEVTYDVVYAGQIRDVLEEVKDNMEDFLSATISKYILNWRKKVNKELVKTLRSNLGDDFIDIDILNTTLRKVVHSIELPDISYHNDLPDNLKKSGKLRNTDAEVFMDSAKDYLRNLKSNIKVDIKKHLSGIKEGLLSRDIAKDFFMKYEKELNVLHENIENQEMALDRRNKILQELKKIK